MATTLQLLLRLPPALRCHTIAPLFRQSAESNFIISCLPKRLLSNTTRNLQRSKPAKPPAKPTGRQRTPPPPRQPNQTPPQPSSEPAAPKSTPKTTEALLSAYLKEHDVLLLYKSPNHTSFYINSYLMGALLLLGGLNTARNAADNPNLPKTPYLIKSASIAIGAIFAIFATTFFMAPQKLVRSIALMKGLDKRGIPEAILRFEMKHPMPRFQRLPFLGDRITGGGGVIEAPLNHVFLDRNVSSSSSDLTFYSIPVDQATLFTDSHFHPAAPAPKSESILSRLGSFNRSLLNIFPTLRQDVRRMFLRDGMAYIRITDHGDWKVDLQGCEVLEMGKPLDKVMVHDEGFDRSWWRKMYNAIR